MAVGRRKAGRRREPVFDAMPIPGFGLRLTPGDRSVAAEEKPDREAALPVARRERRGSGDEEKRPRPARGDEKPDPKSSKKRSGRGGGKRRSLYVRLAYWGIVLALWGVIGAVGAVVWAGAHLPPIQSLEVPPRPPSIQILGLDGKTLATRGDMGGAAIAIKDIPPYLPQAFIAIEDRRFYSHHGFDPIGLARAVVANVLHRGVAQGGSTLTQQLAKNLFLTQERTYGRKLQELALALWLEHKFSKTQILDLYLNRVYFGSGAYGVEAAAQRYFGKSARQVTLAEAAVLAGLVKSPTRLSPTRNPDGAERRAQLVLAAMTDAGFVTDGMAKVALAHPAHAIQPSAGGSTNYVADWVMDVLDDLVGRVEQDIVVQTSVDAALQASAEKALTDELAQKGEKFGVGQGAMVVMSPDGAVRALVGGRNYADSQFNRAIAARRQPGSAFKPFVYLTALERGLTPETLREDRPISIKGWRPENYGHEYLGAVTLTRALANSLNTVSVRLTLEVGPKAVVATAHRLGITSKLEPNASISLGTSEVSVLELVSAYAPFANGGIGVTPHIVERIRSVDGKLIYRRDETSLGRVIDERQVGMMNAMMQETLTSGTARKADIGGWPAAGKTGTSQDFRDAWFIGYTSHLVAGVWLGNDDNSSMKKITGGSLPVEIWSRFMKGAHQGIAVADLPGRRLGVLAAAPPTTNGAAPARPTGALPDDPRPPVNDRGSGLDGWLIDKLFGRR